MLEKVVPHALSFCLVYVLNAVIVVSDPQLLALLCLCVYSLESKLAEVVKVMKVAVTMSSLRGSGLCSMTVVVPERTVPTISVHRFLDQHSSRALLAAS